MKADVIIEKEEELLWERDALGCNDAKTLNRTVFYTLSQHFGTRGRQEHHDIRIEELKVVKSPNSETDYVQWTEGLTKTRKGGLSKPARRIEQRMFAVGSPRCPGNVASDSPCQMMLSKRPDKLKLSGSLYLTPRITETKARCMVQQAIRRHSHSEWLYEGHSRNGWSKRKWQAIHKSQRKKSDRPKAKKSRCS